MPKRRSRNEASWGRKRQFLGRQDQYRIANRSKVKRVKLLHIGNLVPKSGWFNAGYIFPSGYTAIIDYKDLESPNDKAEYMCTIKENHGRPLFTVKHMASEEAFSGKSPTACWKQILDRINDRLRERGLPVVKTQVAGPEYFGLNDPQIVSEIEYLDTEKLCDLYWTEKENILKARQVYEQQHPKTEKKVRKRQRDDSDHVSFKQENEGNTESTYSGVWSSINRRDRYLNRLKNQGETCEYVEEDNPMTDFIDAITLQPVVVPAISPYGHVVGYYSWLQALKESDNVCPFTKLPLTAEWLIKLTNKNYEKYKDVIIPT